MSDEEDFQIERTEEGTRVTGNVDAFLKFLEKILEKLEREIQETEE